MKARVKATEEMVEIIETDFVASNGMIYDEEDLIITKDEPDYWEKLKHQYAGQFLQGMIIGKPFTRDYVEDAYNYATALVNKLKEDSQCEK